MRAGRASHPAAPAIYFRETVFSAAETEARKGPSRIHSPSAETDSSCTTSPIRGYWRVLRKRLRGRDWVVVDASSSDASPATDSLLTGNLAAYFLKNGSLR